MFYHGDLCWLDAVICNPGSPRTSVPFFVLLDAAGQYFFYPGWSAYPDEGIDYQLLPTLPQGATLRHIIPEFTWPAAAGHMSDVRFYSALVDVDAGVLMGEMGSWEFGFE